MLRGENIARIDVIRKLAEDFSGQIDPYFNISRFNDDLVNDQGLEAFRKDMHEVNYREIKRFPTLIFRTAGVPAILITGYRPYAVLWDAVQALKPGIQPVQKITDMEKYRSYWPSITSREMEEIKV
jgi:predicted DsbA family dithiol-disulfide isomerase